jgi:hypothetical protein
MFMQFYFMRLRSQKIFCASVLFALGAWLAFSTPALTQDFPTIPDFYSGDIGWIGIGNELEPLTNEPGPVRAHPDHPYISNAVAARTGAAANFRVADLDNPILQPWVIESLAAQNEVALSGAATFDQKTRCWPPGVPSFHLNPVLPIFFLQTPDEVWMMLEPNHEVRRVAINQAHSDNLDLSWFGESVGHYEGDTLVVDTVGFNDITDIDNYRTRHSTKLHIVERIRLVDDGSVLEISIYIEDEGAFTRPWSAIRRFRQVTQPMVETVCAENNETYFGFDVMPIPQDNTPDF